MGGKFHPKLNTGSRPIANKYHEGKVKRTLKRELRVLEIAERDANETSVTWRDCCMPPATACRRNASVAEGHQQGTCGAS